MQTIPCWIQILLSIATTIIGALLSAYISYKIYVWFTSHNSIKYLKDIIKLKLSKERDISFYCRNDSNPSEINFLKTEITEIHKKCNEISYMLYKLTGKSNKFCCELQNKLKYIENDISIIDLFIEFMYPSVSIEKRIQIETTFNARNIINDIRLKSLDKEIQRLLDAYPIKNGIKVNSFKLLE